MPKSSWLLIPIFIIFGSLVGCEDEDLNKILKAQECLNKATTPAVAAACEGHVAGLNSSESWIIRCSARMLGVGIDEAAMVNAYDAADAAPDGQLEATLISNLGDAVIGGGAASGPAFDACQQSEVDGLIYLSGLINIGAVLKDFTGGAVNPNLWIDNCQAVPGNCNDAEIGEVAVAISDSYCNGGNQDTEVCIAINSAINLGGGFAAIGQSLYNLIDPIP
jgi:hypothetical protein